MKNYINIISVIFLFCISQLYSQRDIIEIEYKANQDNSVNFNYKKKSPGNYFVMLKFSNLNNTRARYFNKVIKSNLGSLLKLKPINPDESIGFQYSYTYFKGDLNSKIEYDFPYVLPFDKGTELSVQELFSIENVYLRQELPGGWKAYSFSFKETKIVRAIRKGVVIKVINKYSPNLENIYSFYGEQNEIMIEHNDGSVAVYKGFDNNINVRLGELIYPQSKLGELAQYDKRGLYRLYLNLYSYKTKKGKTLFNIKNSDIEIVYITPKFFINENIEVLKNMQSYIVNFTDKVLFKEMRKREIKKYKAKL
jgi:hypothetical protein